MKLGKIAKSVLGTVAPAIAGMIGGPFGGLASQAVKSILGVDSDGDINKLLTEQLPETLEKLRTGNHDFEIRMQELGIEEDKVHAGDRHSARQREMETSDKTPRNLAYIYTAGFFLLVGAQVYMSIGDVVVNTVAVRLLDTSTGVLFAMMLASKDYFFGSSSGSKMKDIKEIFKD